jgi:hypothetical protein
MPSSEEVYDETNDDKSALRKKLLRPTPWNVDAL